MISMVTYVPLYVQGVLGGSPTEAGSAITPMVIGWPIASAISGRALPRIGFRPLVRWGLVISAVAAGGLALFLRPGVSPPLPHAVSALFGVGLRPGNTAPDLDARPRRHRRDAGDAHAAARSLRSATGSLADPVAAAVEFALGGRSAPPGRSRPSGVLRSPLQEAAMRAGLAGFARSGKTTLFNALTGLKRGPESKLHLGAIKVPDPRLDKLSAMFNPRKTTPAEVLLADLPGPRSKGMTLEPDALQALREVDALCLVLGAFSGETDPAQDLRDFDAELILSDLQVAEKRLHRLRQERNAGGETLELQRVARHLESGAALRTLAMSDAEEHALVHFGFLSRKPMLVVVNVAEAEAANAGPSAIHHAAAPLGADPIPLSARVKAEIAE